MGQTIPVFMFSIEVGFNLYSDLFTERQIELVGQFVSLIQCA